ncbi:MAG: efflux RND transporter permease subunit [Thermoanaerobaculia bacterium]
MRLIDFSLKRRVTVSMCAVALVIFGVVSYFRLPINLLPDISYPSLTVETRFPGAAPAEVEALVTRQIEEVVGIIGGVQRMSSTSRPGLSQVTLEFDWGRNMDFAALDVRQKLDMILLPRDVEKPVILRFDPANDPIMRMYIAGGRDLYQLRYVAEEVLKKDLESTDGVAAIKVNGGYEEEIEVRVDEGKLALLGLTIQDVNLKLGRENVNQAGGSLYEEEARYLVRARNEFENLDDILETVVVVRDGRNVTMADIATVERTHKRRAVITRFDGKEAVELAMYKEGNANVVQVARSVRNRIENVRKELPDGIEMTTGGDQSRFIQASVDEVLSNALLGGIIAILVLLLFLKDLRSTIIIGISIPVSIVATFFLMYRTGTSLNIMSLGGLALGVGMLVDNAIVVLEAIFKKREAGASPLAAAHAGASEVGMAVIASTLTTVAVFLPVVFLEGIAAQLFRDQALTVSFSLIASLAVSLTLIPMMAALVPMKGKAATEAPVVATEKVPLRQRLSSWWIATRDDVNAQPAVWKSRIRAAWAKDAGLVKRILRVLLLVPRTLVWVLVKLFQLVAFVLRYAIMLVRFVANGLYNAGRFVSRPIAKVFDASMSALTTFYPKALGRALDAPLAILGAILIVFVGAVFMIPQLGLDLIPAFSQGEFFFRVELPEGTPIEATDRYIDSVQSVLETNPHVQSYSSIAGGAGLSLSNTGTEGENAARIQVQMKEGTTPEQEELVIDELREKLSASDIARFKFERPTLFTFRTPIEVEVYGDNIEELFAAAAEVRRAISEVPGLVDIKTTAELGNPELQVTFNRGQLAQLGLNLSDVTTTVRNKVQGEVATRFTEGDREIDIQVRSVDLGAASVDDVREMIVGQIDGRPIFLKSVADIKLASGPSEVRRIGQKRAAVISANLSGRDMGAVAADIRAELATLALPAGVTASLSGQEEEMQRSMRSLMMAMALAIFLVYIVMASQFESLVHPFVIIFTLPLGLIGVVAALALTGRSISIVALIGAVMLAGIVVNNAIVLIDTVNQNRRRGVEKRAAIVEAGLTRIRPILMTSLTTILGLLPMALGIGDGAELRAPLAITVIGGLTVATLFTLIVIPVVYSVVDRKKYAVDAELTRPDEDEVGLGAPEVVR